MYRLHGLDCRELELVGQVHALLLQLAAGFADALRDLRAQALILLVAPAVPISRPTRESGGDMVGEGEGHNH